MLGWAVTSFTVAVAKPADWIIADVAVPPPAECAVGYGDLPASTAPQLQSCDAVASLRFVSCAAPRRWIVLFLLKAGFCNCLLCVGLRAVVRSCRGRLRFDRVVPMNPAVIGLWSTDR